jgi:hypothetical protein
VPIPTTRYNPSAPPNFESTSTNTQTAVLHHPPQLLRLGPRNPQSRKRLDTRPSRGRQLHHQRNCTLPHLNPQSIPNLLPRLIGRRLPHALDQRRLQIDRAPRRQPQHFRRRALFRALLLLHQLRSAGRGQFTVIVASGALTFRTAALTNSQTLPNCITPENPARYPPIKAGEYILERLRATAKDG